MTVAGWAREVTLVEPEGVDRATVPVGVTLTAAELVDKPVLDVVLSVDDADTVALLVTVEALELDPELVGEAVPLVDTLPVAVADIVALLVTVEALELDPELVSEAVPLDEPLPVPVADIVTLLVTVEALELDPELVGEAVPLDDTLPVTLDVGLPLDVLLDDSVLV